MSIISSRTIFVCVTPGESVLHRTPYFASPIAQLSIRALMPAAVGEKCACFSPVELEETHKIA
jgi:hypothetical protein